MKLPYLDSPSPISLLTSSTMCSLLPLDSAGSGCNGTSLLFGRSIRWPQGVYSLLLTQEWNNLPTSCLHIHTHNELVQSNNGCVKTKSEIIPLLALNASCSRKSRADREQEHPEVCQRIDRKCKFKLPMEVGDSNCILPLDAVILAVISLGEANLAISYTDGKVYKYQSS